jgi:photosystem II stability/assembly factor-like uncharacterized protein
VVPTDRTAGVGIAVDINHRDGLHETNRYYLLRTTDGGRSFHAALRSPQPLSLIVAMIDGQRIWTVTGNCAAARFRLHRTTDGGRRWQSDPIFGPDCNAGSEDVIQFRDARHGVLTVIFATGPGADLYRTNDGGRHWRHISSVRQYAEGHRLGLPNDVPVVLGSGGGLWLGGVFCCGMSGTGLWRSRDGLRWSRVGFPRRHVAFGQPSVFGRTVIEPVLPESTGGRLAVFRSRDAGASWRRLPLHLPRAAQPSTADDLTASSSHTFWLRVFRPSGDLLFVTRDAGRRWHRVWLRRIIRALRR